MSLVLVPPNLSEIQVKASCQTHHASCQVIHVGLTTCPYMDLTTVCMACDQGLRHICLKFLTSKYAAI